MEWSLLRRDSMHARVRLTLWVTAFGFMACGGAPEGATDGGFDLNDVSFLFPLPSPGQESQLPAMTPGLLPRALYGGLPVLVEGADPETLEGSLRIIAARVDPCFPGTAPPAAPSCLRQVRLVAQPVHPALPDAGLGLAETTDDATVHLFYTLSEADFAQLKGRLAGLRSLAAHRTDGEPLGVHPVMKSEGLTGPYAVAVKSLITDFCSEARLSRVAFMAVSGEGRVWRFGAFNLVAGVLVDDTIPRLGALKTQGVQDQGSVEFRATELLPTVAGDDLDVLLSESELRLTDERTLNRALTSALMKEHPERSSPKTVDCASCHVATRARSHAELSRHVDTKGWADHFQGEERFDLRRMDGAGDDPRALRAFGYFGNLTALSQRTINESAVVAATLSR